MLDGITYYVRESEKKQSAPHERKMMPTVFEPGTRHAANTLPRGHHDDARYLYLEHAKREKERREQVKWRDRPRTPTSKFAFLYYM